ncbi:hypothetical protein HZA97_05300 [Candidatus Woesearchaeota archaeon]|nr:hypothetical protein [Candidatus Woesearchaeota archaeon]
MTNNQKIRKITEADVPLELVTGKLFEKLRKREHTDVCSFESRSSEGILISEGFSRCQGVCFLDPEREVGLLAHNRPEYDPYNFLTGKWVSNDLCIEDPRKVFADLSRIVVVHIYHEHNHSWPENWISGALEGIGINKIIHIPIKSNKEDSYWRHIVQDVREGSVYVFPTDFNYGIKYTLNKKQ